MVAKFVSKADRKHFVARALLSEEYVRQLRMIKIISSRGFLCHSDIKCEFPELSSGQIWEMGRLVNFRRPNFDGLGMAQSIPTIYVCTDALSAFVYNLRRVQVPAFLLLSGDSDLPVSKALKSEEIDYLAGHPSLVSWYAQNRDVYDRRIRPLPIGVDFHTGWQDPKVLGQDGRLPLTQESELLSIREGAAPWLERQEALIYADWISRIERGDRQLALLQIESDLHSVNLQRLPRLETWKQQVLYRFVSSPSGEGYDCHRTWEALALGVVPIIKRHVWSDGLFDQLPVLQLGSWADVSIELLLDFSSREFGELATRDFLIPLTQSYWQEKFKIDKDIFYQKHA